MTQVQSQAADGCDAQIIRASAGTGKTFALSNRYLKLLARGCPPDRILATTFTRKAAGEIQSRVLQRLARAAMGECAELVEHVDRAMTPQRARGLLAALARNLHRLRICTLDSFFVQVAGGFTPELGLPIGWRIVDETTDRRLRNEAIRRALNEEDPGRIIDLIRLLNPGEVRRSVHGQIERIIDGLYSVFQRQPRSEAWSWLDAPRELAAEGLEEGLHRLRQLEPLWPANKTVVKALAKDVQRAGARDWLGFLGSGLAPAIAGEEATYARWPIPTTFAEAYRPLITHARAVILGRLASQTAATHALLEAFDSRYRRVKQLCRVFRFDDITTGLANGAMLGRLDEVYYRLDGRIEHLLLDEFQDTAPAQWAVLSPLADETNAAGGRSFFCVGDLKQAIYGWRGGSAEIFSGIADRWRHIKTTSLDTTYRCAPAVIDTVNSVFGSLRGNEALAKHTKAAEQWEGDFNPHTAIRKDSPGYVCLQTVSPAAAGVDQHASTLAQAVEKVRDALVLAPGGSVGVLVRTNRAVNRVIFELRRAGIDASEEGGNPLTDCPPVAVLLSLLHLADHPGDTAARFHVCTSPLGPIVGLGDFESDALALRVSREVRRELLERGYGPTLFSWVGPLAGSCDRRSLDRLMQLVELGHRYDPDATLRPGDFVRFVERQRVADPSAAPVRVMTAHQAKGLEFDTVILPELDGKLIEMSGELVLTDAPDPRKPPQRIVRYPNEACRQHDPTLRDMCEQATAAKVREALCVLYVMMTRARHALHMLIAPSAPNERTLHTTFAGVLRGALNKTIPAAPDTVLYERGRPYRHEAPAGSIEPAEPPPLPRTPLLARADPSRPRIAHQRSPSRLEGSGRVDLTHLMRLDDQARARGVVIHNCLKELEWAEQFDGQDPDLQRILQQPEVRRVLSRASYRADAEVRVLCEEPFVVRFDDGLMSGAFDRVVLTQRGGKVVAADVIDFKTDALKADDPAQLERRVEFYRPQLQAYRRAAATLYQLDEEAVAAKLLFISTGAVVSL